MSESDSALPEVRQRRIMEVAVRTRVLKVRALARELGVHEMTVRRDLEALSQRGLLVRTHGGATLAGQVGEELAYSQRSHQSIDLKEGIAAKALELIRPRDTVALDASTTSLALARRLNQVPDVTVIASGLDTMNVLAQIGVSFVVPGGTFHEKARSITGTAFSDALSKMRVDVAFFSCKSFDDDLGPMDAYPPEVETKRALLRAASRRYLLVDSSKFGSHSLLQIAPLSELDGVVTDMRPSEKMLAQLAEFEVDLHLL